MLCRPKEMLTAGENEAYLFIDVVDRDDKNGSVVLTGVDEKDVFSEYSIDELCGENVKAEIPIRFTVKETIDCFMSRIYEDEDTVLCVYPFDIGIVS